MAKRKSLIGVNTFHKRTKKKRPGRIRKKLKESAQEEFQNAQINIQKIIRGKNIEDKEDNYGYNRRTKYNNIT